MTFKPSGVADTADNIIDGEDVKADVANRPHDQAFVNTDQLASTLNADRNMVISGGGTIGWTTGTEILSFSGTIYISLPGESLSTGIGAAAAVEHTVTSGSVDFSTNKKVAAIKVDRTANQVYSVASDIVAYADMDALLTAIEAESPTSETARFDYIVIAKRDLSAMPPSGDDHIILWDGRRIRTGETIVNSGATDTQYAQDADFQTNRVEGNQDRNIYLVGGGVLTWEGSGYGLKATENFYISMPHGVLMQISAATFPVISNGECYICTISAVPNIDRADDATTVVSLAARALSHTDVDKDNDNLLVFAVCRDDRLYLLDGTVIEEGYRALLGGLAQGVRWIFHGPGTDAAAYDFSSVGGSIVKPDGATPEYYPGGTELQVFVNGIRYVEGRFMTGGATLGDYDEPANTTIKTTSIEWTPTAGERDYPQATDRVVAFVGLANPNMGPTGLDVLTLADSSGTGIANIDLSTEELREDAADPTIVFTDLSPNASIGVGPIIADPVSGRRAQGVGTVDHGALLAYSQRPQIHYDDTDASGDYFFVSPGELPGPLATNREVWLVHRLWQPLQVSGDLASPPATPGGLVYVYLDPAGTKHDGAIIAGDIEKSTTAPIVDVDSATKWLAHPSNANWIYLGCYWAHTTSGPVFDKIRPFDRVGDKVIFRAGSQPEVLNDSTGWAGSGGQITGTDLSDYVPVTAHAAILQVQFDIDMADYDTGGGTAITGVAFYGIQSTPPGTWPSSIADAHDVQYLVQPLGAATSGTMRFAFGPFILPVNDMTADVPSAPSFDMWVGPYMEQVWVHVVGFVENQQHIYRHR